MHLRNLLNRILLNNGTYCSRVISQSKLKQFFPMVWPVPIGQNLIRMGAENDGGYVIPNDLDGINACFSPGVGSISEFEEDLARLGIPSFLADGSINQLPNQNSKFKFTKKYLTGRNSKTEIRLGDWILNECKEESGDFILQMDIEGGEYIVIYDTPVEVLKKFRIMVIEFHCLDLLITEAGFHQISFAFSKLTDIFSVVHIHPCNTRKPFSIGDYSIPTQMEFTFLRKDRVNHMNKGIKLSYPHILDSPNIPNKIDYPLPKCWYETTV